MGDELKKAVGQEYEGPSGVFRDSQWLTSEDLPRDKDVVVKIETVLRYKSVTFEAGRTKENMGGLKFVGKDRILLLNATRRKVLNKAFGTSIKGWKGQTISLYVGEATLKGETVDSVKIRSQRSRIATAAEEALYGDDEHQGEPTATAEPANGDASNGHTDETPDAAFNSLCELFEIGEAERAALLARHDGDFDAATADLQKMQTIAPAEDKGAKAKPAGGELGL